MREVRRPGRPRHRRKGAGAARSGGVTPDDLASRRRKSAPRGVHVEEVRRFLLGLPNVTAGLSYGMPSFLLNGRFFARFRDDDTIFVLQLESIADRDVLMEMEPRAFFFTDHYRNYPAVLVRLAEAPEPLLEDVIREAWRHVSTKPPARPRSPRNRSRRPSAL